MKYLTLILRIPIMVILLAFIWLGDKAYFVCDYVDEYLPGIEK